MWPSGAGVECGWGGSVSWRVEVRWRPAATVWCMIYCDWRLCQPACPPCVRSMCRCARPAPQGGWPGVGGAGRGRALAGAAGRLQGGSWEMPLELKTNHPFHTHARTSHCPPPTPVTPAPPPLLCQELCVDQDRSSLHAVARALHSLQQRGGTAPRVMAKGDSAVAGGWGGGGGAGGRQGGWVGERMAGGEQPPARVCSLLDPFPGLPAPLLCVS